MGIHAQCAVHAKRTCDLKILLLGSHLNYNLEHYVYMNLARLGYDVRFYGYREKLGRLATPLRMAITRSKNFRDFAGVFWLNKANEEIKKLVEEFTPHLVLSIKGEAVMPKTLDWIKHEVGAKTALWYPDDPRFFQSLVKHVAPNYDYVFTSSENAISMYKELGIEHVYRLPFACEPIIHRKMNLNDGEKKKYDVSVVFAGTYTRSRARFIKALMKARVRVQVYGSYWKYFMRSYNVHDGVYGVEMVKLFNSSKVVLNFHADSRYGPNMRVFEATGSGAFLLTDNAEDLGSLFKIGKEIMIFNDVRELLSLSNYYLNDGRERDYITNAGYVKCHGDHTYEKRLRNMIGVLR